MNLHKIYFVCQLQSYELQSKREYLVIILIMPERHFHFLSVVADRLQDGPAAWPQLRNESEGIIPFCLVDLVCSVGLVHLVLSQRKTKLYIGFGKLGLVAS